MTRPVCEMAGPPDLDIANPLLFEIAWEVANKGRVKGGREGEE